jgi:translation initiation factor RLI1
MTISIEPDKTVPYPTDLTPETGATLRENMEVAANTCSVIEELGGHLAPDESDDENANAVFRAFAARAQQQFEEATAAPAEDGKRKRGRPKKYEVDVNPPALYKGQVAERIRSMLNEYNSDIVADASELRRVVTNKLLDLSSCGDPRIEIKATEMLGKISDVGLFSEKTEITVTYNSVSDIDNMLKDKIRKLLTLHAEEASVLPDLDKELAALDAPAEDDNVIDMEPSSEEEPPAEPENA